MTSTAVTCSLTAFSLNYVLSVSKQLAGLAINLASDGLATDSQVELTLTSPRGAARRTGSLRAVDLRSVLGGCEGRWRAGG
jgi:hypothetical protein